MKRLPGKLIEQCRNWVRISFSKMRLHFVAVVLLFPLVSPAVAQEISVELRPDSTHILIGDFLRATLQVKFPASEKVILSPVRDTLGQMELVKASGVDTSTSAETNTLTQTYTVSAYDSGNFRLGPQRIFFAGKGGETDTLLTDVVMIAVSTVPVDTTRAIKPIKQPLQVPYTWQEFAPFILLALLLIAAMAILIYYIRKRKRRKPAVIERPKPKDPPHIWARKELKKLEDEKLWQRDEVKQYYSRLTDILRMYLEYRYGWFALESTTEQISEEISVRNIPVDAANKLLAILKGGDMVKFARRLPLPDENDSAIKRAYEFVEMTEQKEIIKEDNTGK